MQLPPFSAKMAQEHILFLGKTDLYGASWLHKFWVILATHLHIDLCHSRGVSHKDFQHKFYATLNF